MLVLRIVNMEERRRVNDFNQRYGPAVLELERLRVPFVLIRFGYLREYFEVTTEQRYTPDGLARMLLHATSGVPLPGTEYNPWEHFKDRPNHITEEDYYNNLFASKDSSVTPTQLFLNDFNAYLHSQRVAVKLETDDIRMYWRIA